MMDDAAKKKVLARLRRIAGQVEGIARMIDEDRYCVDILLQIASAQAALGQNKRYIDKNGQDLPEPRNWQWPLNHA